uniref:Uncharacterized protein n=1 Tax=Glossina austeni TaxID=7395 RepID=A0A1A9VLT3_GLOAU
MAVGHNYYDNDDDDDDDDDIWFFFIVALVLTTALIYKIMVIFYAWMLTIVFETIVFVYISFVVCCFVYMICTCVAECLREYVGALRVIRVKTVHLEDNGFDES